MRTTLSVCAALLAFMVPCRFSLAQDSASRPKLEWHKGPYTANLGEATLKVPEHFAFADGENTRKFMEMNHNPASGSEVGVVIPTNVAEGDPQWFVLFEYDETGYIKDDEKSSLDADKILAHLKEATEHGNEERKKRGWAGIHVTGWQTSPFYDTKTNNLTWATLANSEDEKEGQTVNYAVRLLGRRGTMHVDLVMDPRSSGTTVPAFDSLMSGFAFKTGNRYVDFAKGDKVASYGLTALIAGGATAAAIKTGLFTKLLKLLAVFWKFILVGFAAAWASLKRSISKLFKKNESDVGSELSPDATDSSDPK